MTEEIIIDGVDVAGCDYVLNNSLKGKHQCPNKTMPYAKETSCTSCKVNSTLHNFCKNNPNCYYKQLKRLEQENKELKENLLDKYFPRYYDIVPKRQTVELYNKFDNLKNQNNNYRSALEEIKEDMEQDTTCESRECGCDDYAECLNCIKETILTKINEVLNDK